jgi:hypothetical protein
MTSQKKKMKKETSYLKKITICCSKHRRFKSANNNFDASFELNARLTAILDPQEKWLMGLLANRKIRILKKKFMK